MFNGEHTSENKIGIAVNFCFCCHLNYYNSYYMYLLLSIYYLHACYPLTTATISSTAREREREIEREKREGEGGGGIKRKTIPGLVFFSWLRCHEVAFSFVCLLFVFLFGPTAES